MYISIQKYAKVNHKNPRELCKMILKNRNNFSGHMRIRNGIVELDEQGTGILEKLHLNISDTTDISSSTVSYPDPTEQAVMISQRNEAAKLHIQRKETQPWMF